MKDLCIVLVEPKVAFNVGSICRSMMNFGIKDLRLVNPRTDFFCNDVKKVAIRSFYILENVKVFSSLFEAVSDCDLVFGTTRRFGKHRVKQYFVSPRKAAAEAVSLFDLNKIAYVFGREDTGLSNSELKICNTYVSIPTSNEYKSINLSHSVAICLYELQRKFLKGTSNIRKSNIKLASAKNTFAMISNMNKILLEIGYLKGKNYEYITKTFYNIFIRSKPSIRETKIIQGLWNRITWMLAQIRSG